MISASKSILILNNHKILRPKVMKNLTNLPMKFCEFPPCFLLHLASLNKEKQRHQQQQWQQQQKQHNRQQQQQQKQ